MVWCGLCPYGEVPCGIAAAHATLTLGSWGFFEKPLYRNDLLLLLFGKDTL
jgi:hypothetical protein